MPKRKIDLPHEHGAAARRVLERMPSTSRFNRVAQLYQLLQDPTRLRILWFLCHCSECVTDIGAVVGMSVAAVSHHLQVLRRAGVITSVRHGKEVHYTLARNREARLLHRSIDALFDVTQQTEPCPIVLLAASSKED